MTIYKVNIELTDEQYRIIKNYAAITDESVNQCLQGLVDKEIEIIKENN